MRVRFFRVESWGGLCWQSSTWDFLMAVGEEQWYKRHPSKFSLTTFKIFLLCIRRRKNAWWNLREVSGYVTREISLEIERFFFHDSLLLFSKEKHNYDLHGVRINSLCPRLTRVDIVENDVGANETVREDEEVRLNDLNKHFLLQK